MLPASTSRGRRSCSATTRRRSTTAPRSPRCWPTTAAAVRVGFPVAMKATGLPSFPKTEAGGLALDLHDEDEVRRAYDRMHAVLGAAMAPAVVQRMAEPGVDLRVRLLPDPVVGTALA